MLSSSYTDLDRATIAGLVKMKLLWNSHIYVYRMKRYCCMFSVDIVLVSNSNEN